MDTKLNLKTVRINFKLLVVIFSFSFLFFNLAAPSAEAATIARPMQSLGLVGYWSFDVGKGTAKAVDMSGRGNHGTLTNMNNAGAWVGGKIGNALDFDGVDDFVSVGTWNLGSVYTVSAWVLHKTSPSDYMYYIAKDDVGDSFTVGISPSGKFYHAINDGTWAEYITTLAPTINVWQHVTWVRNSNSNLIFYLNGEQRANFSSVKIPANTGYAVRIGSAAGFGFMNGNIDEPRVYNRALSAEEIKRLYRQTSPQMNASQANKLRQGLVGMWTFDGNDMGTTSAIDRSGNGNTGWLVSGPKKVPGKVGQAISSRLGQYINLGNPTALNNLRPISISLWTKFDDAIWWPTTETLLQKQSGNGAQGWLVYLRGNTNLFTFRVKHSTSDLIVDSSVQYTVGKWTHWVITWDGSLPATSVHIYKDGIDGISGTSNGSGSVYDDSGFALSANSSINGTIDELRIYNRIITPAEIRQLYKAGSSFHPNVTNKSSIRDGLVGHWSFDGADMGTTSARDASGAGNTGWLINGTKKAIGKIGQALNFDGVNDYVNLVSSASLDLQPINRFTLSAWVNPSRNPDGAGIISGGFVKYEIGFDVDSGSPGGKLSVGLYDGTWHTAYDTVRISNNVWTYIAGTWDGTKLTLYKNGIQITQTTPGGSVTTSGTNYYIGQRHDLAGWNDFFPGLIDEVRVYNRALNSDEIKRLYNMGR